MPVNPHIQIAYRPCACLPRRYIGGHMVISAKHMVTDLLVFSKKVPIRAVDDDFL